ncbi:GPP34 family phosphoprotein [Streptomyces canus]|uniref:GOLPH3/VPS74 family protein n=1 Tax=Streptomyces canus TaxID=58343 RepID=UPI00224E2878|nr:GPP34 family phosphoprotein [Streptomyces canus]MCX4855374.1 GPP34 family phosphoprotein [Streptomyces canus]WSW39247.1 GPP34 family phosphoprotein [Streptomyces canus]
MPVGPLSLPAHLYLLAWDTSKSEITGVTQIPQLVRAGALTELAQRGLLVDDDGIATPVDMDASTGDAVLDGLLELVRESRPHRWRSWVTLHTRITLDAVREQLAAGGSLRARKKRALGLFPTVEYDLARPAAVEALQEEARRILQGPVPAVDISDRDAAVVALAAAAGLRTLLPRKESHDTRVEELIERSGQAAPALRKVVHELRGAVAAASTGA